MFLTVADSEHTLFNTRIDLNTDVFLRHDRYTARRARQMFSNPVCNPMTNLDGIAPVTQFDVNQTMFTHVMKCTAPFTRGSRR